MKKILLALAILAALATGALADKIISRTYFTVVLTDVTSVTFRQDALGVWALTTLATVRASDGANYPVTYTQTLTAGQKTSINTFITNNVLPGLNTQEGL